MRIRSVRIKNFRRLKDVFIDLDDKSTVFVGANNSGKTSATHVFRCFFDGTGRSFTVHDFSADCWAEIDRIGQAGDDVEPLPTIELDIWFDVEEDDLHRAIAILPSLDWKDQPVGVRLQFGPKAQSELLERFRALQEPADPDERDKDPEYVPWPGTLCEYLQKELSREYQVSYFMLDHAQFCDGKQIAGYEPLALGDSSESGGKILATLLQVDFLDAQRFLSDYDMKGRTQDLSRRLSSFYRRHLEQRDLDFDARRALAKSEYEYNLHLDRVFRGTLKSLNDLGYPGLSEPSLVVKAEMDSERLIAQHTSVHYELRRTREEEIANTPARTLPDRYNGLGFKNLIYMVVELIDFHERWAAIEVDRPPVHLILIEEPEVHLHVQLQQVFIRKIHEVVTRRMPECPPQLIVTTHSPHIIDESEYAPIRYFRRTGHSAGAGFTDVLNLASLNDLESTDRNFLRRYLKLTHCDLFFADAAILVEGNVERLLMPLMIEKAAKDLAARYITVLEVGGAYAHRFTSLLDLLGIPVLVITDIDSVNPKGRASCPADTPGAITSNQTLRNWLPASEAVVDLLGLREDQKVTRPSAESKIEIRLAYQTRTSVTWSGESRDVVARTLEEAFAYENLQWIHESGQEELGLAQASKNDPLSLSELADGIYATVKSDKFKKTEFALALMTANNEWTVPEYIASGLQWLQSQVGSQEHGPVDPVTVGTGIEA